MNLSRLENLFEKNAEVTPESLAMAGVMKDSVSAPVVVLGQGTLTKPLTVKVHRVSEAAKAAIEKVGGKVELLPLAE